ncbi:MAG TPA: hypothetical protein VGG02_07830 [Chthoniobacterales bacterium]|jgi:D-alanine-D-alanine ligase-like ATP-grasp enzyme
MGKHLPYSTPQIDFAVDYAIEHGIPHYLEPETGFFCALNFPSGNHIIFGSDFGLNTTTAQRLATDKFFTERLLLRERLAVVKSAFIKNEHDLLAHLPFAKYPAIIKPNNASNGEEIYKVSNESEAKQAFALAATIYPHCLFQEYIDENEYRLFVFDGHLQFSYRRRHFEVIGDSRQSIADWINQKNAGRTPRQQISQSDNRLLFNLKSQGLDLQSVPELGKTVRLFHNANLKSGGEWAIVDDVSGYFADIAIRACRVTGLRIGAIDLFAGDISAADQSYWINEVNGNPGVQYFDYSSAPCRRYFTEVLDKIVRHYTTLPHATVL